MNNDIEVFHGARIGSMMKGIFIDGDVVGWDVDRNGRPHHEDVDPNGDRYIEFSNIDGFMGMVGSGPPIELVSDILRFFADFKNDTEIAVDIAWSRHEPMFSFLGTVGDLKTFFKNHPSPNAAEYEDGEEDTEFEKDYADWTKLTKIKKTARSILGRGGRDDSWQDKDEDWSKSFSVYNNPKEEKKLNAAFWKWFGDSKVVDKNGDPLIVYHGTSKKFRKFNLKRTTQKIIWFSSDRAKIERGDSGAEGRAVIMELLVSMQNPAGWKEYGKLMLDQLIREYDGAILPSNDGHFDGFVFSPTQIKSIDNDGTWDLDDSDIRSNPR